MTWSKKQVTEGSSGTVSDLFKLTCCVLLSLGCLWNHGNSETVKPRAMEALAVCPGLTLAEMHPPAHPPSNPGLLFHHCKAFAFHGEV